MNKIKVLSWLIVSILIYVLIIWLMDVYVWRVNPDLLHQIYNTDVVYAWMALVIDLGIWILVMGVIALIWNVLNFFFFF